MLAAANEREAEFASKYTFPQSLILNLHTAPRINKLRSRARFLAAGAGFGQQDSQVHVLASCALDAAARKAGAENRIQF